MKPGIHIVTGPTAVGKTAWALEWAEAHQAEIVSCDSLLVYRGMDIGTAKPTREDQARVPHHLIDVAPVNVPLNVSHYHALAREAVHDILSRGKNVLVTGGSGFYLKSFYAPIADKWAPTPEVRQRVNALFASEGLPGLVRTLHDLNPDGLGSLDTNNPRRVIRALERCLVSGQSLLALQKHFESQPLPFAGIPLSVTLLERPAEELHRRIEQRTAAMLQAGLIDEVARLRDEGLLDNPSAASAIGYRETLAYLEGKMNRTELENTINRNTRQLVAKQRKWFRHQLPPHQIIRL